MSDLVPDLQLLTNRGLPVQHLDAGEKVFLEHEAGDALYVVLDGTVEIITFGRQLEQVGRGGIFGEVALIDHGPRSAAAMAMTNSEVLKIDRTAFLALVRDHPEFSLQVMHALAQRLRRSK